ncbi:MAG: hypothetical protein IPP74_14740 [Alphaproteobacteria bacterium]|nr:hypothetical protein [Alphaproteobacteria bacterium]
MEKMLGDMATKNYDLRLELERVKEKTVREVAQILLMPDNQNKLFTEADLVALWKKWNDPPA